MIELGNRLAEGINVQIIENPIEFLSISSMEANSVRRAATCAYDTALEKALEIKDQIKIFRANVDQKRPKPPPTTRPVKHDHFVDGTMALNHWQRRGLDRPS
jgi:hypothetical protein